MHSQRRRVCVPFRASPLLVSQALPSPTLFHNRRKILYHCMKFRNWNQRWKNLKNDSINGRMKNWRILVKNVEPTQALIFGRITTLSSQGECLTFDAVKMWVITFSPISFNTNVSGEQLTISKDYIGLVGARHIFAFCKILIKRYVFKEEQNEHGQRTIKN